MLEAEGGAGGGAEAVASSGTLGSGAAVSTPTSSGEVPSGEAPGWGEIPETDLEFGGELDVGAVPTESSPSSSPVDTASVPPQPTPPQQVAPQPAGEPAVSALAPSLTFSDPLGIAKAIEANFSQLIPEVARTEFALSQQEIEALELDAAKAVPQLLAKTFLKAQQSAIATMAQIVPAMLAAQQRAAAQRAKNEDAFYAAFPQFDRAKHQEKIFEIAKMYRMANPQASTQEMIRAVGPLAAGALGISLVESPISLTPQASQASVRLSPFRPAAASAPSSPLVPNQDPWSGMLNEYED